MQRRISLPTINWRQGEDRGKKSELPDSYPHCASLTLRSRPHPRTSTPRTGTRAHRNLTHTYHLGVGPPGWQSLWQLGTTKASSPTTCHLLGYQLPNPEGMHRGEGNTPQIHSKPSYIESMASVGDEILLTNLPRGLAAGEDPATSNSLPVPFLKHEMPGALARFQLVTLKPRAMLACSWVRRQTECRRYWGRWAVYEEEEKGDSAKNSKEQSSPRELGARLCGMGRRQK